VALTFDADADVAAPFISRGARPRVAILREQGVNGQIEMAAAFHRAGFDAVDVHMTDILAGRTGLAGFRGLAVCGGFSYGDVLGAGEGWAKSILFNARARDELAAFFARAETFTLGVCKRLPDAVQPERADPGRRALAALRAQPQRSVRGAAGAGGDRAQSVGAAGRHGGLAPAHRRRARRGTRRAAVARGARSFGVERPHRRAVRRRHRRVTERYPRNPNGSPGGITALTTPDGRATILMPHPERVFRSVQLSWRPPS